VYSFETFSSLASTLISPMEPTRLIGLLGRSPAIAPPSLSARGGIFIVFAFGVGLTIGYLSPPVSALDSSAMQHLLISLSFLRFGKYAITSCGNNKNKSSTLSQSSETEYGFYDTCWMDDTCTSGYVPVLNVDTKEQSKE